MTRFEQKPTPGIYLAMVLSMVCVFVADLYTPLGIAVWIVYLVPVGLSVFGWRPQLPVGVATLATAAMVFTFLTDVPGISAPIAEANRALGIVTIWVVAFVAHQSILNKLAVKRQDWLRSGQMGLSDRMSGNQRADELADNILRYLAEYIDAQSGAFFIEESGRFRRAATYAIPEDAVLPRTFAPGDGLLGQAARDQQTFLVSDVPEGYLTIGSALGKGLPKHLLITCAKDEHAAHAVLEFGFLNQVHGSDRDLLELVSQPIAVAVRSANYRQRLQDLLEETERQARELQAQSEELRVINEELEEQSRALKESQEQLEIQHEELEQTNTQLEEQTQLLESQKDELARAQQELQAQAKALEQASRYKSEFIANMSHELRTPLNSSLILAKLLADNRDGNLTEEQVKYARTIHAAGSDLLLLINDILDLSKIEAGRLDIRPQKVRVPKLFNGLQNTFGPIANQKSLSFRTTVLPGTPDSLESDPRRLEQVLNNLLSNAFKFTETGEVVLEASSTAADWITFSVRDTGTGIPEDQQESIFDAFQQGDESPDHKAGGTGLGLSICRELVRLLGGSLHLTSEVGSGSTFMVTVPLRYDLALVPAARPATHHSIPTPDLRPETTVPHVPHGTGPLKVELPAGHFKDDREHLATSGRIILVVEDDEPFAQILLDLAHEMNFQCLVATSAGEGIALAAQFQPSAIILDIGLPDNTGLTVLDRVKMDMRLRHIPVHIVSVSDYSETALSMGATGYELKPVKREELARIISQLETRLRKRHRRVLIVEDDPVQLDSLRALLGSHEVETTGVQTAEECLELLQSTTFDCMVLDLSLPGTSGFSLLETLSNEDRYSFPPVIVYTGRELTMDQEDQLRRYSSSIIIKGAKSPERLLDEVTLFLHQVVAELPPEQQKMLAKAHSRDAALEGRRILIVEDDVRSVFAITSIFEPRGATIQIARNGREALLALDRSQQKQAPPIDLVLMDIMMPEMDGITTMQEIRKHAEWKKLPIIALTAKAMKTDQALCLEAGANDFIAKPLEVEKLASLVRVWMPR